MKAKRILGVVLAAAMLLPAYSTLASAAPEEAEEAVCLEESFEEPSVDETQTLVPEEPFHGWVRSAASGAYVDDSIFQIEKEPDGNQALAHSRTSVNDSSANIVLTKNLDSAVDLSKKVRFTFRLKHNGANNIIFSLGGAQFYLQLADGKFYPGVYSNAADYAQAAVSANVWHEIEVLLDFAAQKYEYYIDGVIVTGGLNPGTAEKGIAVPVSKLESVSVYSGRKSPTVADKTVYIDDVRLSAANDKKICELAAERAAAVLEGVLTADVELPSSGYGGASVTWSSDNPALVSDAGKVTRPASGGVQTAVLTGRFTCGEASADRSCHIRVLPMDQYLYEDFEYESAGGAKTFIPGEAFYGWAERNASGASYDDDSVNQIVKDSDGNRILKHYRTAIDSGSAIMALERTFGAVDAGSPVRVKFRLKRDANAGNISVDLGGLNFYFRFGNGFLYPGQYSNDKDYAEAFISANVWHDVELLLDLKAGKYEYKLDGTPVTDGKNAGARTKTLVRPLEGLDKISIYTNRTGESVVNQNVYFDEIEISKVTGEALCNASADELSPLFDGVKTNDISLPGTAALGTEITWESNNEGLVSKTGKVTRPESGEIQMAELTAVFVNGEASAARTYIVRVLPADVFFYEDFESAAAGGTVEGYNGWTQGNSTTGTPCFDWSAAQETAANKAAYLKQFNTDSASQQAVEIHRTFDQAVSDKTVSVRTRFKTTSLANFFKLYIGNSDQEKELTFRLAYNDFLEGGKYPNRGNEKTQLFPYNAGSFDVSRWHDLEIVFDMVNKKYNLYVDGNQSAANYAFNTEYLGSSFDRISLGLVRNNWGGIDQGVYFDDITVKVSEASQPFIVEAYSFKNAAGEACAYPQTGGSVSGVILRKLKPDNGAVGMVAVYDGSMLVDAALFDSAGTVLNQSVTLEITAKLPEDLTDLRISAFMFESMETLKPLIKRMDYQKEPVTVYIAGDSTAENVAAASARGG